MRAMLRAEPPDGLFEEAGADTQPLDALRRPAGDGPSGDGARSADQRKSSRPSRALGLSRLAGMAGLLARRPRILHWAKYATSSIVAGVSSTGTLLLLYGLSLTGPRVASVIAFLAGAVPNYLLSRSWTWRGRSHAKPMREVIPYLAIILTTTVTAAMLTGFVDDNVDVVTSARWLQVLLVGAAFVGTYAVMFVVKFLFLDRFVFTARRRS